MTVWKALVNVLMLLLLLVTAQLFLETVIVKRAMAATESSADLHSLKPEEVLSKLDLDRPELAAVQAA
ncbi:MAG: hypothetical protein R6V12_05870, partial [Candidatus Hydrogenedentota bacterium]